MVWHQFLKDIKKIAPFIRKKYLIILTTYNSIFIFLTSKNYMTMIAIIDFNTDPVSLSKVKMLSATHLYKNSIDFFVGLYFKLFRGVGAMFKYLFLERNVTRVKRIHRPLDTTVWRDWNVCRSASSNSRAE